MIRLSRVITGEPLSRSTLLTAADELLFVVMEYLTGLTMGLAYVAPIGLQNLFVINTALTAPRRRAVTTALAVIFFDVSLALACFFGAGFLMDRLPWLRLLLLGAGSLVVLHIGIGLLRSREKALAAGKTEGSFLRAVGTACVVTWFNPQAILDGTLMLGAFHASLSAAGGLRFICGVASASCLWFLGVTLGISLFSARFTPRILLWINRICGCVVIFYGLKLLGSFFTTVF